MCIGAPVYKLLLGQDTMSFSHLYSSLTMHEKEINIPFNGLSEAKDKDQVIIKKLTSNKTIVLDNPIGRKKSKIKADRLRLLPPLGCQLLKSDIISPSTVEKLNIMWETYAIKSVSKL